MQTSSACALALLVASLALNGALCLPQQANSNSKQQSSPSSSSLQHVTSSTTTSSTTSRQATPPAAAATTTTTQRPASSLVSLLNQMRSSQAGAPQKQAPNDLTNSQSNQQNNEQYATFDGKNPFSDDSLWRIPIHLASERQLNEEEESPSRGETLAKSASEQSKGQEHHLTGDEIMSSNIDEDMGAGADQVGVQESDSISSSSPTIISASTSLPATSSAQLSASTTADLKTAAGYHHASPAHGHYGDHHGGHHGYHGKYYQYASVPYPYAWESGYKRGNPYHTIERHEHGKGPHFQTKVKWSDKYGGYGVHVWDYNHDDHHSNHYGGDEHHDGYKSSHGGGAHHGYGHH